MLGPAVAIGASSSVTMGDVSLAHNVIVDAVARAVYNESLLVGDRVSLARAPFMMLRLASAHAAALCMCA